MLSTIHKKAWKKALESFRELSEEENIKKRQYGHERYKTISEDEKLTLNE